MFNILFLPKIDINIVNIPSNIINSENKTNPIFRSHSPSIKINTFTCLKFIIALLYHTTLDYLYLFIELTYQLVVQEKLQLLLKQPKKREDSNFKCTARYL